MRIDEDKGQGQERGGARMTWKYKRQGQMRMRDNEKGEQRHGKREDVGWGGQGQLRTKMRDNYKGQTQGSRSLTGYDALLPLAWQQNQQQYLQVGDVNLFAFNRCYHHWQGRGLILSDFLCLASHFCVCSVDFYTGT